LREKTTTQNPTEEKDIQININSCDTGKEVLFADQNFGKNLLRDHNTALIWSSYFHLVFKNLGN
jgi:hypothetical protein